MYRISGTCVGLLLLGLLCSTAIKGTAADPFKFDDAKEHIKDILTYLYENVLNESVPSFKDLDNTDTIDGVALETSSLLPDEKVDAIKTIVAHYDIAQLEPLSAAISKYLRLYMELLNGDPARKNKPVPLQAKLRQISEVFANKLYGKPKPGEGAS